MKRESENLNDKLRMVEYAYKKLKKAKEGYTFETADCKKWIRGDDLIQKNTKIQFYAEAFFYQVKSFLDLYIKYVVQKGYCRTKKKNRKEIYFNKEMLNRIKPKTSFINLLIKHWEEGYSLKKYSLKNFNRYRNFICHEKSLVWFNGQVDRRKMFKWYVLPDSLNYKKPVRCRKNINLFELCDNVLKSLNEISKNTDYDTRYRLK